MKVLPVFLYKNIYEIKFKISLQRIEINYFER